MTVREFAQKIKDGVFDTKNKTVFLMHGINDYSCPTAELGKRISRCGKFLNGITNEHILDSYAVSYKNKTPGYRKMYDLLELTPLNSGEDWLSVMITPGAHNEVSYEYGVNGYVWPAKDVWEVWRKINERY